MIRKIGHAVRRHGSAAAALTVWCLFGMTATASADDGGARGLPFSVHDIGWVTLAAAALVLLASLLQALARRRRRGALHAVVPRRTDP